MSERASSPPKELPYAYVNRAYGLNVKPGMRVRALGKLGTVARKKCYDHYVYIKFEGTKFDVPVHPNDLDYPQDIPQDEVFA